MIDKTILNFLLADLQPPVAAQRFDNNLVARILFSIADNTTIITIEPVTGTWPATLEEGQWFHLTASNQIGVEFEIMRVVALTGYVLTVERGQEGTAARQWDAASTVLSGRLTAGTMARTPRRDEVSRFLQVQSLQNGVVIGDEARFRGPLSFGVAEEEVALFTQLSTGLEIAADTRLEFLAPELRINGIGFPALPSLVEGQVLKVQDGQIVGHSPEWFLGAFATPPAVVPGGDVLQVGMLYFDLTSLRPKVWTGGRWSDFGVPSVATLATLFYEIDATVSEIDMTEADAFGATFALDATNPEPLEEIGRAHV